MYYPNENHMQVTQNQHKSHAFMFLKILLQIIQHFILKIFKTCLIEVLVHFEIFDSYESLNKKPKQPNHVKTLGIFI